MVQSAQKKFTVFGATGFIGEHLVRYLSDRGHKVVTPVREATTGNIECDGDLGHVVYAIGLTGDFRWRPFETIEAHVSLLASLMRDAQFQSWLMLSSARVYAAAPLDAPTDEDAPLLVRPSGDSLYDLSKLLGEALCLSRPEETVRAVRLSNVYGPGQSSDTFLGSIIAELIACGSVEIREGRESTKDYVSIDDVCAMLERIALSGQHRLYNIASGRATGHGEIADMLSTLTGGRVEFAVNGPVRRLPAVDITRLTHEFGYRPRLLVDDLEYLVSSARFRKD